MKEKRKNAKRKPVLNTKKLGKRRLVRKVVGDPKYRTRLLDALAATLSENRATYFDSFISTWEQATASLNAAMDAVLASPDTRLGADQFDSFAKIHKESGHFRICDRDRITSMDLIYEQWDDRSTAAHHITIPGTTDYSIRSLSRYTGIRIDDMLHHGFGDAHCVDGIGCLVRRQAYHALDARVNRGVENVIRAFHIRLDGLHWEEFTGRDLFQSCRMENIVYTRHCIGNASWISDISHIKLDFLRCVRVLRLKLMPHIILLFLITAEDTNLSYICLQKMLQNGVPERTGTTCNH